MHILLTGAAGKVGSHTLLWLLQRGHHVLALDLVALPPSFLDAIPSHLRSQLETTTCDLTNYVAFEDILTSHPDIEGIVHFGAIPDPMTLDHRIVHNNNVAGSYNVMYTAARKGIRRIVQASSVNAHGLSYSPEGHQYFDELPVTEKTPVKAEDGYAISKAVGELQASGLVRYFPGLRIASLRFHMCKLDYASSVPHSRWIDAFAWTSYDSCASAALLSLTSKGWEGHEIFNIVAPEICYEGGTTEATQSQVALNEKKGTLELMEGFWKGRYNKDGVRKDWWEGRPRASTWDYTKAERLLGWNHDKSGEL